MRLEILVNDDFLSSSMILKPLKPLKNSAIEPQYQSITLKITGTSGNIFQWKEIMWNKVEKNPTTTLSQLDEKFSLKLN